MIPFLLLALTMQADASAPSTTSGAPTPPPVAAPAAPPPAAAPAPVPVPVAPSPAAPPAAPRRIDDLDKPLTGAVPQGSYEAGVKGAFSRTQSLQGPLDGAWLLKDASGAGLYRLQLVDPGFSGGRIEGAWSDMHAGTVSTSGFFTEVARDGTKLTLQFTEPDVGLVVATLDVRPGGGFAGELSTAEPGHEARRVPVILVRP